VSWDLTLCPDSLDQRYQGLENTPRNNVWTGVTITKFSLDYSPQSRLATLRLGQSLGLSRGFLNAVWRTHEPGLLPQHPLYNLLGGNSIPRPSVCRGFVSFLSLLLGSWISRLIWSGNTDWLPTGFLTSLPRNNPGGNTNTLRFVGRGRSGGYWQRAGDVIVCHSVTVWYLNPWHTYKVFIRGLWKRNPVRLKLRRSTNVGGQRTEDGKGLTI
jgi:hypothetical protein